MYNEANIKIKKLFIDKNWNYIQSWEAAYKVLP